MNIFSSLVVPIIFQSFLVLFDVFAPLLGVALLVGQGAGALSFLLAFLAFCVPACGIGVWLATYTQTQQQALLGLIIVAFLALMLSGAIISTENMPVVLRWISYINPLSHYAYLVRNIMLKGPDWSYWGAHAAVMLGVGALIWVVALRRFKTTL